MTIETWATTLTPFAVLAILIMQRLNAQKVKLALDDAAVKSDTKLDVIHGLVNGGMVEQKRTTMLQAKRIQDLTGDAADRELFQDAQRSYADSLARQQRVDSALTNVAGAEHRIVLTDGPMIQLINERLGVIEKIVGSMSCVKGLGATCPSEPAKVSQTEKI